MNGLVLVDELSRRGHHIPVIYMSGQIQAQVTWPGVSGNVSGVLQKPIEAEELRASLRGALEVGGSPPDAPGAPGELRHRAERGAEPAALVSPPTAALERGRVESS